MFKILRLTLIVFAISATSTGVIGRIAGRQATPNMAVFSNPDGTPCERLCLFGIEPGHTVVELAREKLRSYPLIHQYEPNSEDDNFSWMGRTEVVTLVLGFGDDRVSSIEFSTAYDLDWGSLGQVIAVLGDPEWVVVEDSYTVSYWDAGQVEFFHAHRQFGRLNFDDPLRGIIIQAQPNDMTSRAVPWQGFTTVRRYVAARP